MSQEFKVGQRVKVHSGANVEGFGGLSGWVVFVDLEYNKQPCVMVEFDFPNAIFTSSVWCYPDKGVKFNIEILSGPIESNTNPIPSVSGC